MGKLLSLVTGWKGYAAIALACFLAGSIGTYKIMHNANLAGQTKQAVATVRLVERQANINVELGALYLPQFVFINTETQRRIAEVPQHVTPEIDRLFPIPIGFVRLWNGDAHAAVPPASAGSDANPSGVPLSAVAVAHAEDTGALDICRKVNAEWWDWYDRNAALWNKARKP